MMKEHNSEISIQISGTFYATNIVSKYKTNLLHMALNFH